MNYSIGLYEKAMPERLSLEEKLAGARAAGFDFVELSVDETDAKLARLLWSDAQCAELSRAVHREGIPLGSICLSGHRKYPLGSADPKIREKSLDILRQAVHLAVRLGVRIIQLAGYDVYYEPGTQSTRQAFVDNLLLCTQYAAQQGVLLGFETMETPFMDTVEKAMVYVRLVNSPYLGVYPDLGNLSNAAKKYGGDVVEDLKTGRGRLLAMHLKETIPGRYRDLRFGEGHVDFDAGIRAARSLGVGRFVAEAWDQGEGDWFEQISGISAFTRQALDRVFLPGDKP